MSYRGPFDTEAWPERLIAHVVDPSGEPRIHGYDVRRDLARHYDSIDVSWLALRGSLPDAREREALATASVWLAPVHVGQAAAHAALLARIAGAPAHAVVQIATVGLSELAHDELERLSRFFVWLDRPDGPPPTEVLDPAATDAAIEAQGALAAQSVGWFGAKALPATPAIDRVALAFAVLHRLGFDELGAVGLAVCARLPAVLAEAIHVRIGDVRSYPARLPDYEYVEDGELP